MRQHLTVARVAEGLGVAWNTANEAVLAEGKRVLSDDPTRLDGVTAIGVDEHVWRHTRSRLEFGSRVWWIACAWAEGLIDGGSWREAISPMNSGP
ncbi:hypothetical protein F4561_002147 [Lipingzhangella halophila]|uniref:Transposase n=1 Tax=Lipingzhangella halophila TaxID=1783352 RepID=A0A7W7RG79_9ACTN|nr:hypothetical protein [Lipingzhangella halophila]